MGLTSSNIFTIATGTMNANNNGFFHILPLVAITVSVLCVSSFIITRILKAII